MSDVVERVAKRIWEALRDDTHSGIEWDHPSMSAQRDRMRRLARAAIEALHNPTAAMILAGYEVGYSPDPLPCGDVFDAMIDEALK